jgi:hypothetical protein
MQTLMSAHQKTFAAAHESSDETPFQSAHHISHEQADQEINRSAYWPAFFCANLGAFHK